MMGKIIITAILKAKPGAESQLYEALQEVVHPSQNESGCVKYQLHQSLEEEGVFVFYEIWQDDDALKKHLDSDHYKAYRTKSEPLIQNRDVYRLKMV